MPPLPPPLVSLTIRVPLHAARALRHYARESSYSLRRRISQSKLVELAIANALWADELALTPNQSALLVAIRTVVENCDPPPADGTEAGAGIEE